MSQVKLKIKTTKGSIDIECNGKDFDGIFESASSLLDKFSALPRMTPSTLEPEEADSESDNTVPDQTSAAKADNPTATPTPKGKRKKGGGNSANWKIVEDLLDQDQRKSLKSFFDEKDPSNQNNQVAVLAYKLKDLLKRDGFDGHEIHTAFQAVGKKTPANLSGVFGNMATIDLGKVVEKKWTPNFKSDDLVNHDLPAASKE